MTVWGIVGNLGYGKTLFATVLACQAADAGIPVFSNYHIYHKGVKYLTATDLLNIEVRGNCLLVLDEAYTWLESRKSSSNVNVQISRIVLQSRKKGIDIIHTAQLPSTLDLRLRNVTSVLVWALRPTETEFRYFVTGPYGNRYLSLPKDKAKKFFSKYSTHEIVEGVDEIITPAEEIMQIGQGIDKLTKALKKFDLEETINEELQLKYKEKLKELADQMQTYYLQQLNEIDVEND